MKFVPSDADDVARLSLPVRGAWVEIFFSCAIFFNSKSLPVRGAWVEISKPPDVFGGFESLPVRGAWVEMVVKLF